MFVKIKTKLVKEFVYILTLNLGCSNRKSCIKKTHTHTKCLQYLILKSEVIYLIKYEKGSWVSHFTPRGGYILFQFCIHTHKKI